MVLRATHRNDRRLADEYDMEVKGVEFNDTHIVVHRCGQTLEFLQITSMQNWLSLAYLAGKDTMSELRSARYCMFCWLVVGCFLEQVVQLVRLIATKLELMPGGYSQLPQRDPSQMTFPMMICTNFCNLLGMLLTKWTTMVSQVNILSIYTIYWHTDYCIMSFIPGWGYALLIGCYFIMPLIALAAVGSPGNPVVGLAGGCCSCLMLWFVLIPFVFGYQWYAFSFLWNTGISDAVSAQTMGYIDVGSADFLAKEKITKWKDMSSTVADTSKYLIGSNIVEVLAAFVLGFFA
eukprot:NODE_250_length_1754_cov_362.550912.p1 GENE.NODE_250_length_1754_cov_362.550912~~NODE_250_length_1754_cov_362.550912.p1  ORF type:complete len:291 (+),score=65.94 NODE_250_length_1754_cov_362.550912:738-1610(+)